MDSKVLVNIGEQRFDKMVGDKKFYIDKTGFIREWWENGSTVTLITRPRRFGKTAAGHVSCDLFKFCED